MNFLLESYRDSDWKLEDLASIGGRGLYKRTRASQDVVDSCACYIVAAAMACADAFSPSVILSEYPDFKVLFKEALLAEFARHKADGRFKPGFGGSFADGMDGARKNVWNATFPKLPVASYITPILSDKFNFAVSLGWAPFIGIYASKDAYADITKDGSLDDVPSGTKYGHAVRYGHDMDGDWNRMEIIDNYPAKLGRFNEYAVDLSRYKNAGGTMKCGYFVFPKK